MERSRAESNIWGAPGTLASHRSFRTTKEKTTKERPLLHLRQQQAGQIADLYPLLFH